MELHNVIDRVAHLDTTAPAVWFENRWFTWRELNELGDATLELLTVGGVLNDESVGVVVRNDVATVAVLLGALRARRPVLMFSPLLPDRALAQDVAANRPAALVAGEADWQRLDLLPALQQLGGLGIRLDHTMTAHHVAGTSRSGVSRYHTAPGVAATMLTSGTTGPPKRAAVAIRSLAAGIDAANQHHEGERTESALRLRDATSIIDLPLFNISAYLDLPTIIASGRRLCLLSRFDAWKWGEAVRDHRVVVALLVPAAMRMVLDAQIPKDWLSSLRVVRSGSAPLDPALAAAFEDAYDIPVIVAYGATEFSGAVSSLTMKDRRAFGNSKRGSVGRPHPGVELRIVDPVDGHDLGVDEVGILMARSSQIVVNDADGWARTNDLARIDADGFLYIEGRADDVIIRGGFKIDPRDVAAVLRDHPEVSDAVVVPLPDERLGQVPAAAVVLDTAAADRSPAQWQAELQRWVRDHRPPYAAPTIVRIVDELPRTPTLKVAQAAVAQLLRSPQG